MLHDSKKVIYCFIQYASKNIVLATVPYYHSMLTIPYLCELHFLKYILILNIYLSNIK